MIETKFSGFLANNVIQNIGLSIIAEKLNLKIKNYKINKDIDKLKINLWKEGRELPASKNNIIYKDTDYQLLLSKNFNPKNKITIVGNFQIGEFLFNNQLKIKAMFNYKKECKFKKNQIIVFVRLGDVAHLSPPFEYYAKAINVITDRLKMQINSDSYIATDSPKHPLIKRLVRNYNLKVFKGDRVETIFFVSRFRNIILTGGSFNWLGAFLSEAENIIFPEPTYLWHGDIFSIFPWTEIKWRNYAPLKFYILNNHFRIYDFFWVQTWNLKKFCRKIIKIFKKNMSNIS